MINIVFGLPIELQKIVCSFDNFHKNSYKKNVIQQIILISDYKKTYKKIFEKCLIDIKIYPYIKNKIIKSFDRTFFYIDDFRFSKHDGMTICTYKHCSDTLDKPHYHFYCLKTKVELKIYSKNITFYKALIMFNNFRKNI